MRGRHDPRGATHGSSRAFIAMSGCSVILLVFLLTSWGGCLLYRMRGTVGRDAGGAGAATEPDTEVEAIRRDLLDLSGRLSDPQRDAHDVARARNELEALELRLESQRQDPSYLKVRALYESVKLQTDVMTEGGGPADLPPLPPSSIAPLPDTRLVGIEVQKSDLVDGRIFTPGPTMDVKYGPGHFYVESKPQAVASLGGLNATQGWKFFLVDVGVRGKVDLVEFQLTLLDDFRRGFPPHLLAEKEIDEAPYKRTAWREVHSTTSKTKATWLTRVYMLPADASQGPILEIQRQGAAKKIWVQF